MEKAAAAVGLLGVALYIASYQFKKRKHIVAIYSTANFLYVVQYFMLGAYAGAAMDGMGFLSSLLAGKKEWAWIKKHRTAVMIGLALVMVALGAVFYKNLFSPFATAAAIVETSALWCSNEKTIRRLTLIAAPLWLTYNIAFGAYGSAIGNAINIVSLLVAMVRYDVLKKEKKGPAEQAE